jgi:hypothetical protein
MCASDAPDAPGSEARESEAPGITESEAPDTKESEAPDTKESEAPDTKESEAPNTKESEAPDMPSTQAVEAQVAPQSRLDKILAAVPRILSSHAHIIFLVFLGVYLVLLPLVGVSVSSKAELIGGNYTNVTSDLGACIAAGLTVHLVRRDRRRSQELAALFRSVHARHDVLENDVGRAVAAAERAEDAAVKRSGN